MATLKELMGDKTRGDGKRFTNNLMSSHEWFEPIFLSQSEVGGDYDYDWHGITDIDYHDAYSDNCNIRDWQEWTPPKQSKKVKMYRYILKNKHTQIYSFGTWASRHVAFPHYDETIVGTEEMEVKVDE